MANRNDVEDFFGLDSSSNIDEQYQKEYGNIEYVKSSNKWGLAAIGGILAIILCIAMLTGNISIGKPGIQAIDNNTLVQGKTYSEIEGMMFRVENKTSENVSMNTIWYLNGTEIDKGVNSTRLKMELLKWGSNTLEAVNGEDKVTFIIEFNKFPSDTDIKHNLLSMMATYPDSMYQ